MDDKQKGYVKVRFTSKTAGVTAGLILDAEEFAETKVTDVSRLFPVSEAAKMKRLEWSPTFATWEEAFGHDFDAPRAKRVNRIAQVNPE